MESMMRLEDGIDFVAIVTPNATHYEIAKAFLEAGIHVCCEEPDRLKVVKKGGPVQIYGRGTGYVGGRAAEVNYIPSGHPEGLTYAFANIYRSFMNAVLAQKNGADAADMDFPTVSDGVKGVRFVHAVVRSNKNHSAWTEV